MKRSHPRCCRIVLTGGPGGGKTTAADLLRREIGDRVVFVPHNPSFFKKISFGLAALEGMVALLAQANASRVSGKVRGLVIARRIWQSAVVA